MKKVKRTRSTTHKYATTPVKRSHLVSNAGVGSLIRLRNGATALITGLGTWEEAISLPVAPTSQEHFANREKFLRQYLIRDPELESATGVPKFYQPPRAPAESDTSRDEWQIPAVVFPRSAACENHRCGAVRHDMRDSGLLPECSVCDPVRTGRRSRPHRKRQVPIFLVCVDGHISDIDWSSEVIHEDSCPGADMRLTNSASVHSPKLECHACNATVRLQSSRPCNGMRPWLTQAQPEPCAHNMYVVDRTSVQVYFAQTKSSIHVPPKSGINPDVVDWILLYVGEGLRFINLESYEHIEDIRQDLLSAGKDLTTESVLLHLRYIIDVTRRHADDEEWDQVAARMHELDVFTRASIGFVVPDGRFLEFHESDLSELDPKYFGSNGIISEVVCLTRLTETRVQDGFTRYSPSAVSPLDGFKRMWGHLNREDSWLPAYRAYGEGILFVFNAKRLDTWISSSGLAKLDASKTVKMSHRGVLVHSFAHLMMVRLSNVCGYALPSIRDRMYDLPDGRVAVLVYTADSDIMGTLGGLVEFGEGDRLASLVIGAIEDARWCSQDPVCIGREVNKQLRQGSSCHKCLFVPETSCELMNQCLDRAMIVGSYERQITGLI